MKGNTMKEKVSSSPDSAAVTVQYHPGHNSINLGIQPWSIIPEVHFVDALFGDEQTVREIGRLLGETFAKHEDIEFGYKTRSMGDTQRLEGELGRMVLNAVTGSTGAMDGDSSLYTSLDRGSVNRLIRLLRKARDAAFGKDE